MIHCELLQRADSRIFRICSRCYLHCGQLHDGGYHSHLWFLYAEIGSRKMAVQEVEAELGKVDAKEAEEDAKVKKEAEEDTEKEEDSMEEGVEL